MSNRLNGKLPKHMILRRRKRLRRRNHDTLPRVNPERIEVLHVTDRDAVIKLIPHHLIFNLFPPLQIFFHQNLRTIRKRRFQHLLKFLSIIGKATPLTPKRKGRTNHQWKSDFLGRSTRLGERIARRTLRASQARLGHLLFK